MGNRLAELQSQIDTLKTQVNTDPLTQLFNVRHFRFSLEQEMERTQRTHQATTLIIVDADHFKSVNDHFGHVVGDMVLKKLAQCIQNVVRRIDIPCRYGGEEFAIILPSTPMLVGKQVAERIRESVEEIKLDVEGEALTFTVSAGVDSYIARDKISAEAFVARADAVLYRAKNEGRNRVCASTRATDSAVSGEEKDALFDLLASDDESEQQSG